MRINTRRIWYALFGLLLITTATGAMAAKLTLSCNMPSATANSVRSFEAIWQDDDGNWPSSVDTKGVYRDAINTAGTGFVWLIGAGPDPIPMYHVEGDAKGGAKFRVTVTAGLNMRNPIQQPLTYTGIPDETDINTYMPAFSENHVIWDDDLLPVWFGSNLTGGIKPPNKPSVHARAWLMPEPPPPTDPPAGGAPAVPVDPPVVEDPKPEEITSGDVELTIYGSRTPRLLSYQPLIYENIDYGRGGECDWLTCYPDGNYPSDVDVYPLTILPATEMNATTPNDGSSSHEYMFRVRYHNEHNLPPQPWYRNAEIYNDYFGSYNKPSGVVLYLDVNGTGDYKIYPMQPEDPGAAASNPSGQVYFYHFLPHHTISHSGWDDIYYPTTDEHTYSALGVGVYHYFFACSDDYLKFKHGSYVFEPQPVASAWGQLPMYDPDTGNMVSTGLDPSLARTVVGLERPAHRRYSTDGFTMFDYTTYVDRPIRAPGFFEETLYNRSYPFPASEHPVVTCELKVPPVDDLYVRMDDKKYGYGRIFGTILPYRRAVNPRLPGAYVGSSLANRAECAGSTTTTDNTFRILYRQIDGKKPLYVRVKINNASERSGTTQDHVYAEYTMSPEPTQAQPYDYKTGVWYTYKTKLPAGPHTYYFEANDGLQKVIWPRRPDKIVYNFDANTPGERYDWWVPTGSLASERGTATYDNNDFVPGPYVNFPCVLSNQSVTPTSGIQTQNFTFRVKYSDPDGQQPHAAYLYIQTSNDGKISKVQMLPEVAIDPNANNSDLWKQGVYYTFDTASVEDLALEKGIRRYRFEFTDEWGRQTDLVDKVAGETTMLPSGGNWIQGPTITQNYAPTLTGGKVQSIDGTANSATLWTFKVTYSDQNEHGPASIRAFIGKLQRDGKAIVWNNGYDMLPSNATDTVYSDGAEYYYQTRLEGPEKSGEPNITYYYAYVASDGYEWAEYNSATSDASSLVLGQVAQKNSNTAFKIIAPVAGAPIVGPMDLPLTEVRSALTDALIKVNDVPTSWDGARSGWQADGDARYSVMYGAAVDIEDRPSTDYVVPRFASRIASIDGIYLNADLSGTNYYVPAGGHFRVGDDLVALTTPLNPADAGKTVYIRYHDTAFTVTQRGSAAYGLSLDASETYVLPEFPADMKANLGLFPWDAILGVWLTPDCKGVNYLDPYDPGLNILPGGLDPLGFYLQTTTPLPSGTDYVYMRYYQKGNYHIDRSNGDIVFLQALAAADAVKVDYMFGRPMPESLKPNTAPSLALLKNKKGENISLSPVIGTGSTNFVYSVTYKDTDGPNGQAPDYVRVVIDGVAYNMQPANTGASAYGEGALYIYSQPLPGGSHNYYFVASDGAAIVILDANGVHNSSDSNLTEIIGFEGPYVNTPPTLTDGKAAPNPTGGQIRPWDSVDYTVVYTDADGESPYEYKPATDKAADGSPLGANISESPRVWIDPAVNEDMADKKLYRIKALKADPFETTKLRVIEATNEDGTPPNWADNNYTGKLIQIADGVQHYRVYLVQGNTADTLTISTDELSTVDLIERGVTRFRINGLVMMKADESQQNNKLGITYKITVPKLAVGAHKFHFTARSREDKPQWVKDYIISQGDIPVPYSDPVRFPAMGTVNGPTVVSSPPDDNSAPVLSNPEVSPLFLGPRVQMAKVVASDTVGQVDATKWANIRGVKGVYLNANLDAHLSADLRTNYYDTQDDTDFDGGNITLTTNLPAFAPMPVQSYVQSGSVSPLATGTSLLTVTPDVSGVIAAVTGVYVAPTLTGTDYYQSFDEAAQKITLNQPLPRGTKNVYIKYNYKGGTLLPPVYVEYFAEQTDAYRQGEPLTFRISYRDVDNDPPSYHDSVQGSMRLVFDSNTTGQALFPLNPPVTDYTNDIPFTVTLTDVPTGTHKYHFEGSDGYSTGRYPTGTLGSVSANDYTLILNARPVLSGGTVDPVGGMLTTPFKFKVTYKDTDGNTSSKQPTVWLRLIKLPAAPGGAYSELVYLMDKTGTTTYAQGVEYSKSVTGLASSRYEVILEADDGYQDAIPYPAAASPLTLNVRDSDVEPVILSYSVDPQSAKTTQTFTYRAAYRDPDGDPPVAQSGGQAVEGLTLLIDQNQPTAQTVIMTRTVGSAPDYAGVVGVEYSATVSGKRLGPGNHTFKVLGHDGTLPAVLAGGLPDYKSGPVLRVPYFSDLRVVDKADAGVETAPALTKVAVGQEVVIKGIMKFPVCEASQPANITKVVVQITKPGGNVLSLPASVERTTLESGGKNWNGYLKVTYPVSGDPALITGTTLTMSDSGEWVIRGQWAGDGTWDKAETDDNTDGQNDAARVVVGGPIRAIAVEDPTRPEDSAPALDMVTIPMILGSTDLGKVLGYDKAMQMQIARWSPTSEAYFQYGVQGPFPALKPGEAFWAKPKANYPAAVAIALGDVESGMLSFANGDAKTLDPTYQKTYRLITPLVKAYPTRVVNNQTQYSPCEIALKTGWNQFGNIFFNWKTTALGKQDIGIPISEFKVRYLSQELSLSEAKAAGWIRDYAWRYDADRHDYVLVSPTSTGAERTVRAWYGYWIKALVDCQLIINPNTSYTGEVTGLAGARGVTSARSVDLPPTLPD